MSTLKMKSLLKEKLLQKTLKENRIYFVPLNKILDVVDESNEQLANIFQQMGMYASKTEYYNGKDYETILKEVFDAINKVIAANNTLRSKVDFTIKKTKEKVKAGY